MRITAAEDAGARGVGDIGEVAGITVDVGPGKPGKGHGFHMHGRNTERFGASHKDIVACGVPQGLHERPV